MTDMDEVMKNIYDVLMHLRYSRITNAESKDIETTVLCGENRVCLLSWLLTEKVPSIAAHLKKLQDDALADKLLEYYSQIGICNNKDVLLGKCSLEDQLPFLRLLLDFMRKVHVEPFVNTNTTQQETFTDIIKLFVSDTDHAVGKPKLSYIDAIEYFEQNEKETLSKNDKDIQSNLSEDVQVERNNKLVHTEQSMQFHKEKFIEEQKKFIEAFETISSWPVQKRNVDKNISDSICLDITRINSDFHTLRRVLQARDEISKVNLSTEFRKTATPLHAIIEDIVIYNEKLNNLLTTGDSD